MGLTVGDVISLLDSPAYGAYGDVDGLKVGNDRSAVSSVAVTYTASYAVVSEAISLGANLLITHEPTFYNHTDELYYAGPNQMVRKKLLHAEQGNLSIYRCHDFLHRQKPDIILAGLLSNLLWSEWSSDTEPEIVNTPNLSIAEIVAHVKNRLALTSVRFVGDAGMTCRRVAVLPGMVGGKQQIEQISKADIDLLIVGEVNEWETSEYVRDAIETGAQKSLLIIGHQESEESGMEHFTTLLRNWIEPVSATFLKTTPAIQMI